MAKKKKPSLTKLKKKLWNLFSLYIKLKYSEDGTNTTCFTCGRHLKIGTSNCHGGHYYTKKGYPALYFNENNVRVQCYHCNINLSGNTVIFGELLEQEIGKDAMNELASLRHGMVKLMPCDYEELIFQYKRKIHALQHNSSID